jgi:hypothetical protein
MSAGAGEVRRMDNKVRRIQEEDDECREKRWFWFV